MSDSSDFLYEIYERDPLWALAYIAHLAAEVAHERGDDMPSIFGGKKDQPEPSEPPSMPARLQTDELSEEEQRVAWKFLMLLELGFSIDQSQRLVEIPHFDWHDAERLLKKKMPHEYVVRELLP